MSTFLQVVNRVLTAIGQADDLVDTGASEITDVYHLKVAGFVNDFLEEVEKAAQWRVLRTRDTATVAADGISATLTSSTQDSRVFRIQDDATGELVPVVFDVTDTSAQYRLAEMDLAALLFLDQQNSNAVNGSGPPSHFALEPTASGMNIYLWPRSSTARDIEIDMIVPQARLDPTDSTDLGTSIKVPNTPVVHGATWWALEDRGEELGPQGQKAEIRWLKALADAVAAEDAAQGFDELVPT